MALLVCSLVLYGLLRHVLLAVAAGSAENCLWLDGVACIGATLFVTVRYASIPTPLMILARGIGAVVLGQLLFDASTLFFAPQWMLERSFFTFGTAIGLAAGVIAMWRPSFLLPLLFHYVCFRHQFNVAGGIEISETDYLSMLDVGEFAAIGGVTVAVLTDSVPLQSEDRRLRDYACGLIWSWAVGAHLGNYFVSAWTKIRAGGGDPFLWLLHNPTQTSILIGLERGDAPLAAWPHLLQGVWDLISGATVWVNLFVFGLQFAAPVAMAHRRLLIFFVLAFDLFHIGVYFTLGALFLFWIAVNGLICAGAVRMRDEAITPVMKLTALVACFAGHFMFYTSHLGWLDGAKLASPSFVAETRDGRRVPVPSVFFGMRSYSIAQTVMYTPDDHFPMRIGGNSYNPTDWHDAQTCGPEIRHHQEAGVSLDQVEAMVRETDAAMRAAPLVKSANLYYLYPHHMVANPWMFQEFNRLQIGDILRYHYVVDSVCLSLRDGRLDRDIRKTTDQVIDVGR